MKTTILGLLVLWGISAQCMERTLSVYDFFAAIRANDQKTIQLGIAMARDWKIDVNAKDNDGLTALMQAGRVGRIEVVIELLKVPGIDVNAKDQYGWTVIMLAGGGRTEVVRELLKVPGIDVNARNNQSLTALMLAAMDGRTEVVRELIKVPGIDVNYNGGLTALIRAAMGGHTDIVRELLKVPGIDVNAQDNQGWTALMLAVRTGRIEVVRELLKVPGIDVNIKNAEGHSALAIAIKKSQGQIALLLWAVGAHEEGIQELLPAMEEVREKGKAVFNGINSALKSGSIDALKKISEDGFSLMIIDSQGNNPIHIAVMQNQRELARWLIDYRKQWLIERNKDELNPLDVMYGRWIAEGNNDWGSFVEKLPEEFKPDAVKAKEDWQRYKEKAFNEGYEGMAASLLKK